MRAERIVEFFVRLTNASAASTAGEAFSLVTATLAAVEAEHAGADDRMMPPSGDFHFEIEGRPDLDLYRQRAHDTIIGANGAILIRVRKTGAVQFEKAGADGEKVTL